ncbi:hypothetical protein [Sutcliffiella rhizosphaerae]|uniref:hypothetical protein n=1 Tax=Sutcliffiella rhizosphaerae TaxID=2880967 RepID=UPI001E3B8498|nr:hypothetical protein [Sutcliffiella rhizosphaerae]
MQNIEKVDENIDKLIQYIEKHTENIEIAAENINILIGRHCLQQDFHRFRSQKDGNL